VWGEIHNVDEARGGSPQLPDIVSQDRKVEKLFAWAFVKNICRGTWKRKQADVRCLIGREAVCGTAQPRTERVEEWAKGRSSSWWGWRAETRGKVAEDSEDSGRYS